MIRVPPHGATVLGLDVSHYQTGVDFTKAKASGHEFVFIKATEGLAHSDKSFLTHWRNAKAAGLIRGAYHFFHPKADPILQAQFFVSHISDYGAGDLPLVMDWETTDGAPGEYDSQAGLVFLTAVEKLTKRKPMIYTGPYFFNALPHVEKFAPYKLWLAQYGVSAPLVPRPWTNWNFWQRSDALKFQGYAGRVDENVFQGSKDELLAMTKV